MTGLSKQKEGNTFFLNATLGIFAWLSLPGEVDINNLILQGRTLRLSWIYDLSLGLSDGSQFCELPLHVPLIEVHLGSRPLKGCDILGD